MLRNIALASTSYGLRVLSNLVAFLIIARFLRVSDFGAFSYYYAITILLSTVLDFGYISQLVKRISAVRDNPSLLSQSIQNAFYFKHLLCISVIVICCLICLLSHWAFDTALSHIATFLNLLLSVCFYAYSSILIYTLQGKEAFKSMTLYTGISNAILFLCIITFLLIEPSLLSVSSAFLLGRLLGFLTQLTLFHQKKWVRIRSLWRFNRKQGLFEWQKNTSYFLIYFFSFTYTFVDTAVIKHYLGYQDVGLYQAGMRLVIGCMLLNEMLSTVFLPKVNLILLHGQTTKFKKLISQYSTIMSLCGLLGFAIAALFAKPIVYLLYGQQYEALTTLLPWFFLLVYLRYIAAGPALAMLAKGANYTMTAFYIACTIVAIILNVALVPIYGLYGGLLATGLTLGLLGILSFWYTKTKIELPYYQHIPVLTSILTIILAIYLFTR